MVKHPIILLLEINFLFIFNTLSYGGFLINKTQFDREKVFEALDV